MTQSPTTGLAIGAQSLKRMHQRGRLRRSAVASASLAALVAAVFLANSASALSDGSLRPFVGQWYGHTRSLSVDGHGLAREYLSAGCCDPIVRLHLHLYSPRGTVTRATVKAYVSWVHILDPRAFNHSFPAPRVGQIVIWRLQDGVLMEPATHITYCDVGAGAEGRCGA